MTHKFEISDSQGHVWFKNSWKDACQEIEKQVRDLARAEGGEYMRDSQSSEKNEQGEYVEGCFSWKSSMTGNVVFFFIRKW